MAKRKRKTIRRFCKTCACRTSFSKTKDLNIIICMRCGASRENHVAYTTTPSLIAKFIERFK